MSSTASLTSLLGEADLDAGTTAALQLTADTLGPAIMAGLGEVKLDDITTAEVLLFTLLVDDSGSIRFASNAPLVREGHNLVLDALRGAKQSAAVLISCRYLNDGPGTQHGVLYPYVALDGAKRLDAQNYDPSGGTPLYDQTAVTLTGVAAKLAEFEQGGVAARAVTVIVTDGADCHSRQHSAASVQQIVGGLLRTEQHIIAGMGMQDPQGPVDFRQVFSDMGIQDEWILTPGNSQSEIRRAFQVVSQSAVRASQTAGSFSQVALGGFGG
ncbi:MAG TPA: hypothetical protein VG992_00825 [Candidatus Saccharimonadales bacterium]|nr:hypothetical protein [Candidatus Saccharimonadales bacterium]